jgi:hypothetical protein
MNHRSSTTPSQSTSASSAKAQNKVQCRLLLNVVVCKRATILQLLAGKDQTLLVRRDALLVLDLRLHVVNGIRRLDLEGDRLAGKRLDKYLHATTKAEHKVKGGFLLDVVIRKGTSVLSCLPAKIRRC